MAATLLNHPRLGLFLALLAAGSSWFYIQHIVIPRQVVEAAVYDHPRGNLSDLYPRWLGARELLIHHRDPYSPELTREIQAGYYGRALDPSRPGDPKDQQAFAYPAYVVFLFAPTVYLSFGVVQQAFYWSLWCLTGLSVVLWLRAQRWKTSKLTAAVFILLTLGNIPVLQAIKLQQLTLLVAALCAIAAVLIVNGNFLTAGVVMAFATIKPQLVLFVATWLVLWSLSDWRRRGRFVLGFAFTMTVLLGGAEYVLPGWIGRFVAGVAAYQQYTDGTSILVLMTSPRWGRVLSAVVIALALGLCWRTRREREDSESFAVMWALLLAVTLVVIPSSSTYNQILLLPAVLLIIRRAEDFWRKSIFAYSIFNLAELVFCWPWIVTFVLMIVSIFMAPASVQKAWYVPLWSSMMTPVVVLLLLAPLAGTVLRKEP